MTKKHTSQGKDKTEEELIQMTLSAVKSEHIIQSYSNDTVNGINLFLILLSYFLDTIMSILYVYAVLCLPCKTLFPQYSFQQICFPK